GARIEAQRKRLQGNANQDAEGFVRLLRTGPRQSGRYDSRAAGGARRGAHWHSSRGAHPSCIRLGRPLQRRCDVSATEQSAAAQRQETRGQIVQLAFTTISSKLPGTIAGVCPGAGGVVSRCAVTR